MNSAQRILVTGATGYIGGRLVPVLLEKGYPVRVLVRDPARLQGRPWAGQVGILTGDVLKPESLKEVLNGIDVAYYLIHSMSGSGDFHQRDLLAAGNFGRAAKQAGIKRIIYLGGLGDPQENLSEHLKSRQETGKVLAEGGVPVTEFRAAIIVGSGSISFEMIRYLTERLPVMVCPRWVYTRVQPIAISDLLVYLTAALEVEESVGRVVEIGGAEITTYGDMMLGYARERGLKRYLIPVPVLTPRLSSYWVHWVTPIPADITRPLVEGLKNEVIVRDRCAKDLFPEIEPVDYRTAVRLALANLDLGYVETRWTDSMSSSLGDQDPVIMTIEEGMFIEQRKIEVNASSDQVYRTFSRLGGETGWLYFDWAWEIRGIIDRLFGGVGLRRGRRDPEDIRVGDALDFWRVEKLDPGRSLSLRAEMKLPGEAWLQFDVSHDQDASSLLTQTAFFAPKGLSGVLYWYGLYPIHNLIFSGLVRKLKEFTESKSE